MYEEIRPLQLKQLEILHELDRVCKIAKVKYYLSTGTCLGAVRHCGFIPWDNDIDVYMHWSDAAKLIENRNLFESKYFLQSKETEPNWGKTCMQLRDSQTAYFSKYDFGVDINHGIGIDIYLLYPYPDNFLYAHKIILDSYLYRILSNGNPPKNHGKFATILGKLLLKLFNGNKRKRLIDYFLNEYKYNGGRDYVVTYYGEDITPISVIKYPSFLFDECKFLKFEDMLAPCPADPNLYCKIRYGANYMQLPPEEKRKKVEYRYVDINESYLKFKGIYY